MQPPSTASLPACPILTDPFSYVIAIDSARANRLVSERVWRNLAAITLAVLPALSTRHQREKEDPLAGRRRAGLRTGI